jgi:hypothetical protein
VYVTFALQGRVFDQIVAQLEDMAGQLDALAAAIPLNLVALRLVCTVLFTH